MMFLRFILFNFSRVGFQYSKLRKIMVNRHISHNQIDELLGFSDKLNGYICQMAKMAGELKIRGSDN